MKRFAAHYLCLLSGRPQSLHYIEVDERGLLKGVYPLEQETEAVSFFNGILFLTDAGRSLRPSLLLDRFRAEQAASPSLSAFQAMEQSGLIVLDVQATVQAVDVFVLDGLDLSSPKFRTDDSRSEGYIQRL